MEDPVPKIFDVYVRGDVLAYGGTSIVYKGKRADGSACVIKVPRPELLGRMAREMTVREAYLLRRLSERHDGVPKYLSHGYAGHFPYIVMELVSGQSLEDTLPEGVLTTEDALLIFLSLLTTVEYIHGQQVIHLDLKPDNIIISWAGAGWRVKVIDFGIALYANEQGDRFTPCVGTTLYSSPEQIRVNPTLTYASDIFSLGLILYELLTGRRVFPAEHFTFATRYALAETPIEATCPNGKVSGPLWAMLKACVATNPGQRPTATDLVHCLCEEL